MRFRFAQKQLATNLGDGNKQALRAKVRSSNKTKAEASPVSKRLRSGQKSNFFRICELKINSINSLVDIIAR